MFHVWTIILRVNTSSQKVDGEKLIRDLGNNSNFILPALNAHQP